MMDPKFMVILLHLENEMSKETIENQQGFIWGETIPCGFLYGNLPPPPEPYKPGAKNKRKSMEPDRF